MENNQEVYLGMEQALTMAAQNLVDQGMNLQEIQTTAGLPIDEIEYLQ